MGASKLRAKAPRVMGRSTHEHTPDVAPGRGCEAPSQGSRSGSRRPARLRKDALTLEPRWRRYTMLME